MYDVRRLRLLLELARRGTLSAVAEALHFSTSTVSHQLSQLEAEVGTPLLEPAGRRVRLTPQAEVLVRHAEVIVGELEAAEAAVAGSLTEVTGTIRLASFQTGILKLLSPLLSTLGKEYPGIRLEVFQDETEISIQRLLAHEYDLAIVEEYPQHHLPRIHGIDYRPLLVDPMRIVFPRSATDQAKGTPDDQWMWAVAKKLPWVMEPHGAASRSWVLQMCRQAGFEPDIKFSTDDLLIQRQIVSDGHAVAFLPQILGLHPAQDLAAFDPPNGQRARNILTAVRRESAAHPAVEACRKILRLHASQLHDAQ